MPSHPTDFADSDFILAFVAAYSCGAAPDLHRLPYPKAGLGLPVFAKIFFKNKNKRHNNKQNVIFCL